VPGFALLAVVYSSFFLSALWNSLVRCLYL